MKKVLILLLFALLISTDIISQTETRPWNIAIAAGKREYRGDLSKSESKALFGDAYFNFEKAFYGFASVSVSRFVSKKCDLTLQASVGNYGYSKAAGGGFRALSTNLYFDARYKFPFKRKTKWKPYLFIGIGTDILTGYTVVPGIDLIEVVGIGLDYQIGPRVSFRLKTLAAYSNHDNRDHLAIGGTKDAFFMHSLGVTYCFGERVSGARYFHIFKKTIQIGP
jgi:hypothetical protein